MVLLILWLVVHQPNPDKITIQPMMYATVAPNVKITSSIMNVNGSFTYLHTHMIN